MTQYDTIGQMKLWILRPHDELPDNDNPWKPWYDKVFGFVIRAETEDEARAIANSNSGDETRGEFRGYQTSATDNPWLDKDYSSCIELSPDGEKGLILKDLASA